jgi:hypothetical protein
MRDKSLRRTAVERDDEPKSLQKRGCAPKDGNGRRFDSLISGKIFKSPGTKKNLCVSPRAVTRPKDFRDLDPPPPKGS